MPMKMTRTQFVSTVATAAAAAFFDRGELLAQAVREPVGLSAAKFRPYVNTSFYATRKSDGAVVELVLSEVEVKSGFGLSEQFTLRLLAVNGRLEEGTHAVEHPSLGKMPLFLVASGSAPGGDLYRADFNILQASVVEGDLPKRRR
jgi:hypothetical protein